ncbi:MAG: hypothetical protein ABI024_08905 [Vicinamibacterales bacterium]
MRTITWWGTSSQISIRQGGHCTATSATDSRQGTIVLYAPSLAVTLLDWLITAV